MICWMVALGVPEKRYSRTPTEQSKSERLKLVQQPSTPTQPLRLIQLSWAWVKFVSSIVSRVVLAV